jgi:hypothetical protein
MVYRCARQVVVLEVAGSTPRAHPSGSADAGESDLPVKQVPSAEWVRIPPTAPHTVASADVRGSAGHQRLERQVTRPIAFAGGPVTTSPIPTADHPSTPSIPGHQPSEVTNHPRTPTIQGGQPSASPTIRVSDHPHPGRRPRRPRGTPVPSAPSPRALRAVWLGNRLAGLVRAVRRRPRGRTPERTLLHTAKSACWTRSSTLGPTRSSRRARRPPPWQARPGAVRQRDGLRPTIITVHTDRVIEIQGVPPRMSRFRPPRTPCVTDPTTWKSRVTVWTFAILESYAHIWTINLQGPHPGGQSARSKGILTEKSSSIVDWHPISRTSSHNVVADPR